MWNSPNTRYIFIFLCPLAHRIERHHSTVERVIRFVSLYQHFEICLTLSRSSFFFGAYGVEMNSMRFIELSLIKCFRNFPLKCSMYVGKLNWPGMENIPMISYFLYWTIFFLNNFEILCIKKGKTQAHVLFLFIFSI